MAGTVVDEGGIVYDTLKNVLRKHSISFTEKEFDVFHGANKKEVIQHFVEREHKKDNPSNRNLLIDKMFAQFTRDIQNSYFGADSTIRPISGVIDYFHQLRQNNIKIALNTGYPRVIANHLIEKLKFTNVIDGSVVSEEVGYGRPYPYMIFTLMGQLKIMSTLHVAKIGDTANDMQEGRNAGCKVTIGVLSGADDVEKLIKNGATQVVKSVPQIKI